MDPYAAFRSPNYRFLMVGNFLSFFGLQMMSVAVAWDLFIATKSPVVLGNVGFVQVAPFLLFALFAGHFADKHDRRRIMVLTQVLFFVASALLLYGFRSVAVIYSCLFLTATARALQWPARQAILPHVVPLDSLRNAIAWNSSGQEIANMSGPALAGILLAHAGSTTVYILQAVFAACTLVCYFAIRYHPEPKTAEPPAPGAFLEGINFVRKDKLILPAISLDMFGVLFGGAVALLPIYAVDILHVGVSGMGWLRAAPSIGAILTAMITAHSRKARAAGMRLMITVAGFGAATIVFGLSRYFWLSFFMLALTGVFDNISVVLRQSLVQTHTPDRLRGRVMAVNSMFIACSNQLGAVESGWTAAWFGAVPSVVGGGLATIGVVAVIAVAAPTLRRWQQT